MRRGFSSWAVLTSLGLGACMTRASSPGADATRVFRCDAEHEIQRVAVEERAFEWSLPSRVDCLALHRDGGYSRQVATRAGVDTSFGAWSLACTDHEPTERGRFPVVHLTRFMTYFDAEAWSRMDPLSRSYVPPWEGFEVSIRGDETRLESSDEAYYASTEPGRCSRAMAKAHSALIPRAIASDGGGTR